MSLRRLVPFALALGAVACQPSLPGNTNPQYVDYAVFDLATGSIPTPNDLILGNAAAVPGAQGELLRSFASNGCAGGAAFPACGGWPSDQEVPITVGFIRVKVEGGGVTAPDLDVSQLEWCPGASCNATLIEIPPGAAALPAPVDPALIKVEYAAGASGGTLSIRHWDPATSAYRPWNAGSRYVVALRGGASGLKTTSGVLVEPQPAMYLLLQDKNLSDPANQGLLPGSTPAEKAAAGAQLEQIRELYALPQGGAPLSIFGLVDSQFPHREIAVLASFNIVGGIYVVVDPVSGNVPLPIDLILDPTTGKVANNPGFCQGVFDQTSPPSCGLSRGLATLDGFSTTAMVFAPTSGEIRANSVAVTDPTRQSAFLFKVDRASGVATQLYDLVGAAAFSKAPSYAAQPYILTLDTANPPNNCTFPFGDPCTSRLVGLQPAAIGAPVPLPPLDEASDYTVVITRRVLDKAGNPIVRGTAAQMLLLGSPLVDGSGKSQIQGVPDSEARLLEVERQKVAPILTQLPSGIAKADVSIAYTFHTQSITSVANQLGAAPYAQVSGVDVFPDAPLAVSTLTTAAAAAKYGVVPAVLAGVASVKEATIVTFDKLDPASGAFYSNASQGVTTPIPALVAIPSGAPPWPIVVFRHGLGRGRADMLLMGASLAGVGNMVVVAIDAAKHGDRSWCAANADCDGANGWTCDHRFGTAQGDAAPGPGLCAGGTTGTAPYAYNPVDATNCSTSPCWDGTGGIAKSSASFLIALNLFRTRDTTRQDNLDESMLVRVLTSPAGQTALGLTPGNIDATKVYYVGQSLGSLHGTMTVATNPRISKAVLNVGGGTATDILATSPTFLPTVEALLGFPHTSPQFFQFVQIAKWVLDPGDPINFAAHLVASPLPNLLQGGTQSAKKILGQAALCDNVVPNPTNVLLAGNIGLFPLDTTSVSGTNVTYQWFATTTTNPVCPTNAVPHGFLLSSLNAQSDVVTFLTQASPSLTSPRTP